MGSKAALILLGIMIIGCNHIESRNFEHMDMEETATNDGQICQLCQDSTTKAMFFLGKNETQAVIIDKLHQACSHLLSFQPQCISLIDRYAPLFFVEIAKMQPKFFCEKVDLCKEKPLVHLIKHDDPCTLCHNAINELLTKLDDPETQCKKLVLEYGPIIMANTEKFLEKTDICTAIHACKAQKATEIVQQQYLSASA